MAKTAKELEIELAQMKQQMELNNHDVVAVAKEQAKKMMKQFTQNDLIIGSTLVDIKTNVGKEMIDKTTSQPIIDTTTGQVRCFPDSHYATFNFEGGSIETQLTQEQKENLIVGHKYLCKGRFGMVKRFGNTETLPIFHSFTEL